MAMEFGGEELLCGSCDVDDGRDKRDDATQAHDDVCDIKDGGDGHVRENTFQTPLRTQRTIVLMGTSTPPTLGWRNLQVNTDKESLMQSAVRRVFLS